MNQAVIMGEPATMSTVNLSEVVATLSDIGWHEDAIRQDISKMGLNSVPFDAALAYQAALLRPVTRRAGLSFGDRACLALAQRLGLPAITADRSWTGLPLPITVQVIC